jgi:hypothetical protein
MKKITLSPPSPSPVMHEKQTGGMHAPPFEAANTKAISKADLCCDSSDGGNRIKREQILVCIVEFSIS